jgi:hypothetical protein
VCHYSLRHFIININSSYKQIIIINIIMITVVGIEPTTISQLSRGLGLVACLEGQKINNMPEYGI